MTDLALTAFENHLLMLLVEDEAWTPILLQPTNHKPAFEASGMLQHSLYFSRLFFLVNLLLIDFDINHTPIYIKLQT